MQSEQEKLVAVRKSQRQTLACRGAHSNAVATRRSFEEAKHTGLAPTEAQLVFRANSEDARREESNKCAAKRLLLSKRRAGEGLRSKRQR